MVPNISSAHVTNKTLHEEMPWGMPDSASLNEKIFQAETKIRGFFFIHSRGEEDKWELHFSRQPLHAHCPPSSAAEVVELKDAAGWRGGGGARDGAF